MAKKYTKYNTIKFKNGGILKFQKGKKVKYDPTNDRTINLNDDPYVSEFFEYDVIPRYQKEHPYLTQTDIDSIKDTYGKTKSSIDPNLKDANSMGRAHTSETFYDFGIPIQDSFRRRIRYSDENPQRSTVVHENTHILRNKIGNDPHGLQTTIPHSVNNAIHGAPPVLGTIEHSGYDKKEAQYLENAYDLEDYDFKNNPPMWKEKVHKFNETIESGATNTELRYRLWRELYSKLGRRPTLDEMDDYISNYKDSKLRLNLQGLNGYGSHSVKEQSDTEPIKDALIHVADNNNSPDMTNMARRGGIVKAQGGIGNLIKRYPNQLLKEIGIGKKAASEFFKHPVVKQSYEHNKDIAKRLGITLQDRPENIAEIVNRPIGVGYEAYKNNGELGAIHHSGIDDPNDRFSISWIPMTELDAKRIGFHESLHRGFYSAPIKYVNTNFDYYNNVYQPTYKYWHWKTSKLLKPGMMDSYLGDVHGGEAGTNLAEVGKIAGVKLGQKWPGDQKFWETVNKWPEDKKFMLDYLNTDTRAGRRHIWDAMTGQYFGLGTGIVGGALGLNKEK